MERCGVFARIMVWGGRARSLSGQRTEAAVGVAVLSRMSGTVRPNFVRHTAKAS